MAELSGWLYDQLREIPRGADPITLVEWSRIIERKAIECCRDFDKTRIRFKGTVAKGRFALGIDARDSATMLCLLTAIQDHLDLMPRMTKEFYTVVMITLASQAEKNGLINEHPASGHES